MAVFCSKVYVTLTHNLEITPPSELPYPNPNPNPNLCVRYLEKLKEALHTVGVDEIVWAKVKDLVAAQTTSHDGGMQSFITASISTPGLLTGLFGTASASIFGGDTASAGGLLQPKTPFTTTGLVTPLMTPGREAQTKNYFKSLTEAQFPAGSNVGNGSSSNSSGNGQRKTKPTGNTFLAPPAVGRGDQDKPANAGGNDLLALPTPSFGLSSLAAGSSDFLNTANQLFAMNAQAQQTQGGAEAAKSSISLVNQTPGMDMSKLFVSLLVWVFLIARLV